MLLRASTSVQSSVSVELNDTLGRVWLRGRKREVDREGDVAAEVGPVGVVADCGFSRIKIYERWQTGASRPMSPTRIWRVS